MYLASKQSSQVNTVSTITTIKAVIVDTLELATVHARDVLADAILTLNEENCKIFNSKTLVKLTWKTCSRAAH